MKRKPLSSGACVESPTAHYIIESVIGKGANCVVYKAHFLDNNGYTKEIILKECYPYHADIVRDKNFLYWNNTEEKIAAFDRFQRTYGLADKLQHSTITNSASVVTMDMFTANGTRYIVIIPQGGYSYDKDPNTSILDIVRTSLALCNAVGLFHQAGYLHLDIKPSNFIVTTDHTGHGKNIALFDLDTLISFKELTEQNNNSVSYSDGYASPEQKLQQVNKLCPATDLFAVGAILFSRIMNRSVANDDMSPFATWVFDKRFDAKAVNPKAKRLLTEIFHKSLAANVKRRYQSAEEMAAKLEEVLTVLTARTPYLVTDCPPVLVDVIGRKKEIKRMRECFNSNHRFVVLHGEGGIGKSTIATVYGNAFSHEYDAVLFLRYRDSIESTIYGNQVFIHNYDEYNQDSNIQENRRQLLRSLFDKHVLLILDNYDVPLDGDDCFSDILRLNADVIITTRTDFSASYNGDLVQIEIEPLKKDELLTVFSHAAKITPTREEESEISELFLSLECNTFVVELLGKQLYTSDYSINTLIKKVSGGLFRLADSERITSFKDEKTVKKTLPEIIQMLYDLADLSEQAKQALRNLYLLHFLMVDKQTYLYFCRWDKPHNVNAINDLVETGWVRKNNGYYSLHPLVEEMIGAKMLPCEGNCCSVFYSIWDRMNRCLDGYFNSVFSDAEEYAFSRNCELIIGFLSRLDFQDESNLEFAVEWFTKLIKNQYDDDGDVYNDLPELLTVLPILTKLNAVLDRINNKLICFDICFIIFAFWLEEYRCLYIGTEIDRKNREGRRDTELNKSFERIRESINLLPKSDQDQALDRVYSQINLFWVNNKHLIPQAFAMQRYNERPQCFTVDLTEYQELVDYYQASLSNQQKHNDQSTEEDFPNDPVEIALRIASDSSLSVSDRIDKLDSILEQIMEPFFMSYLVTRPINLSAEEWFVLKQMLDIENDLISLWENQDNPDFDIDTYNDLVLRYRFFYTGIVCAALNDRNAFQSKMDGLFSIYPNTDACINNPHLIDFYCFRLKMLHCGFARIQKASWLLPYLIKTGDVFTPVFSSSKEELALYFFYKLIQECAEFAMAECDITENQATEYRQTVQKYKHLINSLLDVEFSFRSEG